MDGKIPELNDMLCHNIPHLPLSTRLVFKCDYECQPSAVCAAYHDQQAIRSCRKCEEPAQRRHHPLRYPILLKITKFRSAYHW